ncbi:MAG: formate dehydrogenase accessory protein FdhE, partial [Desulfomonile sp.]|nr:formate dehydrogenase accessory protein FdhE [Desulfomonile sp.]
MNQYSSTEAAERIRRSLDRIKNDLPSVANVVDAFSDFLVERARLKAEVSVSTEPETIDLERVGRGVPLLEKEKFNVSPGELKTSAERLVPFLAKGLPKVAEALLAVKEAIVKEFVDPAAAVSDLLAGRYNAMEGTARSANVDPEMLEFALAWLVKPFAEKRAEFLKARIGDLQWFKGYCPVCGSWPALSLLREKEGHRFLRCSFCAHEWRFMRTKCPLCETEDQGSLELLYSEDRPTEHALVCHACKKYVLGL